MKQTTNRWMGMVGTALLAGAAGWLLSTGAGLGLAHGAQNSSRVQKTMVPVDEMSHASPEYFEFEKVQTECIRSRFAAYGKGERWKTCRLEQIGFVGTIAMPGAGLQDFYFASYCLVRGGRRCDKQAMLIFSNRAYRPEAVLRLARIDPAGTRYETPLLIGTATENALALTSRTPGNATPSHQYFGWRDLRWVAIDPKAWRAQLHAQLPKGLFARVPEGTMPDPESLVMHLPLYRTDSSRCCAPSGSAEVQFAVESGTLSIASLVLNEAGAAR